MEECGSSSGEYPENQVSRRSDPAHHRCAEGCQPQNVEGEVLDAPVEQRIGHRRGEPLRPLLGQRIDIPQWRKGHVEHEGTNRLLVQEECLHEIERHEQQDRQHEDARQVENGLALWPVFRVAVVVRLVLPIHLSILPAPSVSHIGEADPRSEAVVGNNRYCTQW